LKQIAILGPTASGKTALSIELALAYNAVILSLDSLSIYKQIDIASAKPTLLERRDVVHFGIDEINITTPFNVTLFFKLYQKAMQYAQENDKNLIIVGGTSFYLKSMMEGLSQKPTITDEIKTQVQNTLLNMQSAYELIKNQDITYANKISPQDKYRIEKWLEIYYASGLGSSEYFLYNTKEPLIKNIEIFEIDLDKELLRQRIALRTNIMLKNGLIDEVVFLERTYTRKPNPMSSIGIKETLDYLDGYLNLEELEEKISTNTARLAKRQRTFNTSQLPLHVKGDTTFLKEKIEQYFQS
jgi:tRNA dimethylallyltransferase